MAMRPPPPRRGPRSTEPLIDDLMREIILRLPPHDPRALVRAAAGCRSWRRILSDAAFARDYHAFRGAPPMLGYLYDESVTEGFHDTYWVSRFVPAATFRPQMCEARRHWRVLDSRNGLVLFYTPTMAARFLVCDLVTGDHWEVDAEPHCERIMWWEDDDGEYRFGHMRCNAAVLCGSDGCDHLDCRGGPFRVALVGSDEDGLQASATVYSSETDEWSDMISVEHVDHIDRVGLCAVLGNKVYVPCLESDTVVEYNMGEQGISVIDTPLEEEQPYLELIGVEDGMLLFASVVYPGLYLWSMDVGRPSGASGWARSRIMDLKPSLSSDVLTDISVVSTVGFAEAVNVIFLQTVEGVYRIDLNSGEGEKLHQRWIEKVFPYMSFYTGAWRPLLTLE